MSKKKRTLKQNRELIEKTFDECLDILNISGYEVTVLMKGDESWHKPKFDYFSVSIMFPYKQVHLYVGEEALGETKTNLRTGLIHEAIHIIMTRYSKAATYRYSTEKQLDDEEENVVDHITNVINALW